MRSILKKSLETYVLGSALLGVLIAGVLSFVPSLRFGTFWQMAAVLTIADLVMYVLMKTKLIKPYRALRRD